MNSRITFFIVSINLCFTCGTGGWTPAASAHTGRRFEIQVINNQLVAQGYISDDSNDGAGSIRPYTNAIHDHWSNITATVALADLPSFDIPTPGALATFDIDMTLLGVKKWEPPTFAPCTGMAVATCANVPTTPAVLQSLTGESLSASTGSATLSSDTLGTASLTTNVMSAGAMDLDISYVIDSNPTNEIFVYEWRLSTNAPGIADSDSVFAIISPAGAGAVDRHHHASLFLEAQLSGFNVVPEPTGWQMAALVMFTVTMIAVNRRHGKSDGV